MQGTCWYRLFISILDEEVVAAEQDVAGSALTYVRPLMPDTITKVAFSTSYHPRYLRGAKEARERRRIRRESKMWKRETERVSGNVCEREGERRWLQHRGNMLPS